MGKRFAGLKGKGKDITVDGVNYAVIPTVGDAETFMLMQDGTPDATKKVAQMMIESLHRGNPEDDIEDVTTFVAMNFGKLVEEYSIFFGFASREDIARARQKAINEHS